MISIIKISLLVSLTGLSGGIFNIIKKANRCHIEKKSDKKDIYLETSNKVENDKLNANKERNSDSNREPNLSMNREYQYINSKILEKDNLEKYKKEISHNIHICDIEIKQLNDKLQYTNDLDEKEEILKHLNAIKSLKSFWVDKENAK